MPFRLPLLSSSLCFPSIFYLNICNVMAEALYFPPHWQFCQFEVFEPGWIYRILYCPESCYSPSRLLSMSVTVPSFYRALCMRSHAGTPRPAAYCANGKSSNKFLKPAAVANLRTLQWFTLSHSEAVDQTVFRGNSRTFFISLIHLYLLGVSGR